MNLLKKEILIFLTVITFSNNLFCQNHEVPITHSSEVVQVITDTSPILQHSTPFERRYILEDTKDYVFAISQWHICVFFKKDQVWKMYNYSSGYFPVGYKTNVIIDYKNYFVVGSTNKIHYTSYPPKINIFDKSTQSFFSVGYDEYKKISSDWQENIKYSNDSIAWSLDKQDLDNITRINTSTGSIKRFGRTGWRANRINDFLIDSNNLYVATDYGIRIYNPKDLSTPKIINNKLFEDEVKKIVGFRDNAILLYDSIIDIMDLNNHQIKNRINIGTKIHNVAIHENRYFISMGNKFSIYTPKSKQISEPIIFSNQITSLKIYYPNLLIETTSGYSSYNIKTGELKHYINNQTIEKEIDYDELEGDPPPLDYYYSFKFIGSYKNYLVGITEKYTRETKTTTNKIELVYKNTLNLINDINNSYTESIKSLLLNNNCIQIFEDIVLCKKLDEYIIYNINNVELIPFDTLKLNSSTRKPNIFELKNEIIGDRFEKYIRFNNFLWFVTDKGLFSYNIDNKIIKCHILPSTYLSNHLFFVNNEGIYTQGYTTPNLATIWSKIDRKTNKISFYGTRCWNSYYNSNKSNDSLIIFAATGGIYKYNHITKKSKFIATKEPVDQVTFVGDTIIALGGENLVIIDSNDNIVDNKCLKYKLDIPRNMGNPNNLESDGQKLYISGAINGVPVLVIYNLNDNTQSTFPTASRDSFRKIIVDNDYIWFIGKTNIYKYDKVRKHFVNCGYLRYKNTRGGTAQISALCDTDSTIILSSGHIVIELNKINYEVKTSNLEIFNVTGASKIEKFNNTLFFEAWCGILEMKESFFYNSFEPDNNKYFLKNDNIFLPHSENNCYIIEDVNKDYNLIIDISGIPIKEGKPLKCYLENIELKIDSKQSLFHEIIICKVQSETLQQMSTDSFIKLYQKDNDQNHLLEQWKIYRKIKAVHNKWYKSWRGWQ